jgi:hypothetical protein
VPQTEDVKFNVRELNGATAALRFQAVRILGQCLGATTHGDVFDDIVDDVDARPETNPATRRATISGASFLVVTKRLV